MIEKLKPEELVDLQQSLDIAQARRGEKEGDMASHDAKVADDMKRQHRIRPTSTRPEVIQAWDRVANPMRGWIEWNIKRHRDEVTDCGREASR